MWTSTKVKGATIINELVHGASFKSSMCIKMIINYFGTIENNYDLNNCRCKLIYGSYSDIIGTYDIDPCLLKMVGTPFLLICVEHVNSNLMA